MLLGFREGDGNAEADSSAVLADADGREHGGVAHDAIATALFVTGIQNEIGTVRAGVSATVAALRPATWQPG